jgi:hypothetical protein
MSRLSQILKMLFVGATLFLTGCMSTHDFTNVVKSRLGTYVQIAEKQHDDNVVLKTDKLHYYDSAVVVRKLKSHFIPAIVYWEKVNTISCDINSRYFVNLFSDAFKDAVSEFQLKNHLGTRRLEINLESVPSNFVYSDKFYGVFTLICFSLYYENIRPVESQIKLTYRILDGDQVIKTGRYSSVVAKPIKNNFNSHSQFIESYLDDLKSNFEYHSEKAILQILDDLY